MGNKRVLLGCGLLLVVAGGLGGTTVLRWKIQEALDRQRDLERQEQQYLQSSETSAALIQMYNKNLSLLEKHQVRFPEDQVAFLSAVEQVLTQVGLEKISMTTAGVSPEGKMSVAVQFKGPYYKVMRAMADWRQLSSVVRMATLNFQMDRQGIVQASTVLETLVGVAPRQAGGGSE